MICMRCNGNGWIKVGHGIKECPNCEGAGER
jgi:DnaJ-class molecular chaperone